MSRKALERALPRVPRDFQIHNVALTLALKRDAALRWKYIPITFRERQGGTGSINPSKIVRLGLEMLRELRKVQENSAS